MTLETLEWIVFGVNIGLLARCVGESPSPSRTYRIAMSGLAGLACLIVISSIEAKSQ